MTPFKNKTYYIKMIKYPCWLSQYLHNKNLESMRLYINYHYFVINKTLIIK